jgi:hypothetical protein
MPGNKRYTEAEIKRIVELRDSGKTSVEVVDIVKAEFNTTRVSNSITFIYKRAKDEVKKGTTDDKKDAV